MRLTGRSNRRSLLLQKGVYPENLQVVLYFPIKKTFLKKEKKKKKRKEKELALFVCLLVCFLFFFPPSPGR